MKKRLLALMLAAFMCSAPAFAANTGSDAAPAKRNAAPEAATQKGDPAYAKAMNALQSNDPESAIKFFKESADQGNADAQYVLGLIYERGWGVEPDINAAVNWLNKAAAQGQAQAQGQQLLFHVNLFLS